MRNLSQKEQVYIRFFHATPQQAPVDVYVNGTLIHSGLSYRQSTAYIPLVRGVYDIRIVDANTGHTLLIQRLTVSDHQYITIIAIAETNRVGLLSLPDKGMKALTLQENDPSPYSYPPIYTEYVTNLTRKEDIGSLVPVRFVHLSPNAPELDLYLDGNAIHRDLIYKEATAYMGIMPRQYRLVLRAFRTGREVAVIDPLTISEWKAQTVYITGLLGGAPRLEAVVLTDGE